MPSSPLVRLLSWMRPYWRGMALSALLGLLTIGSSLALMATSAWMISKAGLQPSIAELGVSVVGVRFFGIARGLFRYLERLVSHDTTFRLLAALRVQFYRAIEPLAPARLAAFHSGDLLARVVGDVDALQNVYLRAVAPSLVALAVAGLLTVLIAAFDPLVALVALAWFGFAGMTTGTLAWWLGRQPGRALVRERANLNAAWVDALQGMPDLIAYGAAAHHVAALAQQAEQVAANERRFARLDALQSALAVVFSAGAMLTVLALAIPRVDGIYLATLALATLAAYEAILPLGQAAAYMGASLEAAQRLFEIADLPPAVSDPTAPAPLPAQYDLRISEVRFRYAPDQPPVLHDLNLRLPYGRRIAIIGESGAGKSTVAHLLVRFWDYEQGSIQIGSVELRDLTQQAARSIFGVMTQRTHLFNTSIRENIRIARPDATDAEVEDAAQAARIHAFILSLPDGYETLMGENGANVSGGERQRIALARVLLKDAPILILDEATAHLDTLTEAGVFETIGAAAQGRTLIVFTHHLHLLRYVDSVYQLSAGQLREIPQNRQSIQTTAVPQNADSG
jgi:ATP-binding cassette subfamily C protein CydC